MERRVGHIISDLLETIERVETKTYGRTFAEFENDWELKFVQRAIEIISEASRRLPEEFKATRPEIEWRSIAGIGNVLRHEYHTISDKVIWDVVRLELPALKTAIESIAATMKDWRRITSAVLYRHGNEPDIKPSSHSARSWSARPAVTAGSCAPPRR
jgi:uncharacterized protein with HEPN domain